MWPNPQETRICVFAYFVTFTEEIYNEKIHFCAMQVLIAKSSLD